MKPKTILTQLPMIQEDGAKNTLQDLWKLRMPPTEKRDEDTEDDVHMIPVHRGENQIRETGHMNVQPALQIPRQQWIYQHDLTKRGEREQNKAMILSLIKSRRFYLVKGQQGRYWAIFSTGYLDRMGGTRRAGD